MTEPITIEKRQHLISWATIGGRAPDPTLDEIDLARGQHGGNPDNCGACRAILAIKREAIIDYLKSLRSKLDGFHHTKGKMEYAVENAWEKATEIIWVNDKDPEDALEMHHMDILANEILNYLEDDMLGEKQ